MLGFNEALNYLAPSTPFYPDCKELPSLSTTAPFLPALYCVLLSRSDPASCLPRSTCRPRRQRQRHPFLTLRYPTSHSRTSGDMSSPASRGCQQSQSPCLSPATCETAQSPARPPRHGRPPSSQPASRAVSASRTPCRRARPRWGCRIDSSRSATTPRGAPRGLSVSAAGRCAPAARAGAHMSCSGRARRGMAGRM